MDSSYSLSDLAAVTKGETGVGGGAMWLIVLFLFLFAGGGFGAGGSYATKDDITAAINAQTSAMNQSQILASSANNNYETARLISDQTLAWMNQNNANQINVIQGFNALSSKLDQLGFALENCCCSIKTLIKDNQIADLTSQLSTANTTAINAAQTQTILSSMGRWVGYPPSATA